MNLGIIFAEFGDRSKANQKWNSDIGRLDPTYSQIKKYFPDASLPASFCPKANTTAVFSGNFLVNSTA